MGFKQAFTNQIMKFSNYICWKIENIILSRDKIGKAYFVYRETMLWLKYVYNYIGSTQNRQ